jgi:hypothetical protein
MDGHQKMLEQCRAALKQNDLHGWTRPAPGLYPHQWLWDSCFIAIGLRHENPKRAQHEITNLFRGQWKNGMLPNIVMGKDYYYADKVWNSDVNSSAPRHCKTSGITQPPMVAEAMVRVGEKLSARERKAWYKELFPKLLAYHEWLYRERDPHGEGLVLLVHPWESGLDNSPAWIKQIYNNEPPLWIRLVDALGIDKAVTFLRQDARFVPASERINTLDALVFFTIARRLKRKKYETKKMLQHAHVLIEDLAFNSILIKANSHLLEIAREIKQDLPGWLWGRMKKSPHALELLWSETHEQYFSRNYDTFELLEEPTIATFLPLYAGTISKSRAEHLVTLLRSRNYWTSYPVPTVPKNSKYFEHHRYWQGPTWVNMNWLIIKGLEQYGYTKEANAIRERTIHLIAKHGPHEYFSPLDGTPAGAYPFSWTAALGIDLLYQ